MDIIACAASRTLRIGLASLGLWLLLSATASAAGQKPIGTMTLVDEPGLAGISIVGFKWAARNTAVVGGGGGGSGKTIFDPFKVVKVLDATSPALLDLTFSGKPIKEARIDVTIRRGSVASYVLSDVIIVANERHSSENGGPPLQELSLSAVAIRETLVTPGGTVTTCYSLKTNSACE